MRRMKFIVALIGSAFAAFSTVAVAAPIKLVPMAVTASRSVSGNPPTAAVDGNSTTAWGSGAFEPQWIQLDLGRTTAIRKIRLQTAQSQAGATHHVVSVGQSPTSLTNVYAFTSTTHDGQWLEFDLGARNFGDVRYLRVTTDKSPSPIAWREIELYGGVEYFGFYSSSPSEMVQTTSAGANLVMVVIGTDQSQITYWLQQASQRGARVLLSLERLLFADGGSLYSDWQARWSQALASIRAAPANSLAAIYVHDEPYLNHVSLASMNAVTKQMRLDLPATPLASVLSVFELEENLGPSYVSMLDWVGLDCYGDWASCDGVSMPQLINALRSWLTPSQRMIAVPWGFRYSSQGSDSIGQSQSLDVDNHWDQEVRGDATYVAVLPFIWTSTDLNGDGIVDPGTSTLTWLQERFYQLSQTLLNAGTNDQIWVSGFSASSSFGEALPFGAFNQDYSDAWNSGGFAPQWIQADFGGSTRVGRIQLLVGQSPDGATTHEIDGLTPSGWVHLGTLSGVTHNGDVITWYAPPNTDVSSIRITTVSSLSWVAWYDIQFFVV